MPVAYNPTPIDFSSLANLGTIPERLRMRDLRNQFSSGAFSLPNGGYDYQKMYNAIGGVDPAAAAKLMAQGQGGALGWARLGLAAEEFKDRSRNRTKQTPTQMKGRWEAEDRLKSLRTSRKAIEEAQGYLKEGVFDKATAPAQTALGSTLDVFGIGDAAAYMGLTDKQKAIRTKNFLKIVGPAAMERMATELKGSTAVQEIMVYKDLFASETATNEEREAQLKRVVDAIDRDIALQSGRISEIEGAGGAPTSSDEWIPGEVYSTPMGNKRYLGNDEWEDE